MKTTRDLNFEFFKVFVDDIINDKTSDNMICALDLMRTCIMKGGSIYFIGNGGSAAICSHMAEDYSKTGMLKSRSFNDSALLTCLANDYSYSDMFKKAIEMYCDANDVLVAISSSGKSENILNAVDEAIKKKMKTITLSGFSKDNPLRKKGNINFYVNSSSYRITEILHDYILHTILDLQVERITEIRND
jgi:D-sedoheptulose 7-phosphate isomerase